MNKLVLLFLALFHSCSLFATHIVGGEITYKHVAGFTYKVYVKLYTPCTAGVAGLTSTLQLKVTSLSQAYDSTFVANTISIDTISNLCPLSPTNCHDINSIYPGYKSRLYEAEVILPTNATDWRFSHELCCRTFGIANIDNSGSQSFYIYANLNNTNPAGGFNNSVQNLFSFPMVMMTNQTTTYSQSCVDPDGDSLNFQFASPVGSAMMTNLWAPGFTALTPFGASNPCTLNNQTGVFTVTPSTQGDYVFTLKIDEYRSGVLVGTTFKDINLKFFSGTNSLPTLSGINGGNSFVTSIDVCPGQLPLTFTINSSDLDIMDSLEVTMSSSNIPGATISSNNAAQPVTTFSWLPSSANIQAQPYILTLNVRDNKCPYNGMQSFAYLIYVNQCATDSVWPGDANSDYIVDNYDVLNIGIGNNTSGSTRVGASTSWTPQYCSNWTNVFASNINYKHADCNGDGIINTADLNAISTNFGLTHLKGENLGQYKTAGFPDLKFDTTGIIASPGSTIQIPIKLGSSSALMSSFYGISGHIKVANFINGAISLSMPNSWIGNSANTILFQKNIANNDIAFTIVKSDQNAITGQDQIATLTLPISPSAPGGSLLTLHFTDIKLINSIGDEISDYNVLNDTMMIKWPTSISEENSLASFRFFPNPVNETLYIDGISSGKDLEIMVMDLFGNRLLLESVNQNRNFISTQSLSKGSYILITESKNQKIQFLFTKM
jgi:hypothetical protein